MPTRKKKSRMPKVNFKNTNIVERETSSFRDLGLVCGILFAVLWLAIIL